MKYRTLGKTGLKVSVLGFGAMRLPIEGGSASAADIFNPEKRVDEELASAMVTEALDGGINYFDTAYGYHGGQSETVLGAALEGRRDSILLATKMPVWMVSEEADFDRLFEEQLRRLRTDRVDVYLLHALGRQFWPHARDKGALAFLDRIRADGRAVQAGFSFHDDVQAFREIVDAYDWGVCQIQYNYFDENYQAGREGLEYAASRGLGVVVMEPLRGGKLVDPVPPEVAAVWDSAPSRRSPVEWALRWVWDQPEVSTALSGMSSPGQLRENLLVAEGAEPRSLTGEERALVARAAETYRGMLKVDCTGCAYCMPCPQGVNIPMIFSLYNDCFMFRDADLNFMLYNHMIPPEARASACGECGECEEKCPQHVAVSEELEKAHAYLARETGAP